MKGPALEDAVTIRLAPRARKRSNSGPDERHPPPISDEATRPVAFKTLAAFLAEYVPLAYTIESLLRGGSLYTLTAKTGAGKTALMVIMALAVATGREDILGLEVVKGRVAFLTAENPDDTRMRFMIACFLLNIDLSVIGERIVILDRREKPEDICASLEMAAQAEPFALILVDTLATFFDGKNISDPVEGGEFLRRIRPFTRVKGSPAVVVAAHPVKNAGADSLIPYGAGAILNEVDGNLTLWKSGTVTLHWQGKLRGLEFEPRLFRFEVTGSPDVLDAKERQVQLPTMRPTSPEDAESRANANEVRRRAVLRALAENPGASLNEIARHAVNDEGLPLGLDKNKVNYTLKTLLENRPALASFELGKWTVTKRGKAVLSGFSTPQTVDNDSTFNERPQNA